MEISKYNLQRHEDFEIRNFIDGQRSILEIRNAVSSEFRPIPLQDIENYILTPAMEGMVFIEKKLNSRLKPVIVSKIFHVRKDCLSHFDFKRRKNVIRN